MTFKDFKPILQFAGILIVGVAIIFLTRLVSNQLKRPDVIEKVTVKEVIIQAPPCSGTYDEFKKLIATGQSVRLINNISMYAQNGQFINPRDVYVNRSGEGQVACGYLYVRVRKDGKSFDEKYDSVYINPQGFGGKLLSRKGGILIPNPESSKTEFLLPLNSVSYIPKGPFDPNAQNYRVADWVKMLNTSNQAQFSIGLSTTHLEGVLEDATIAYKCWDPTTGKETNECQLGLYR